MRKKFFKYGLLMSLMLTAGLTSATLCYGEDEVEVSDFEADTDVEVDSEQPADLSDAEVETDSADIEADSFEDGDITEAEITAEDIELSDVETVGETTYAYSKTETDEASGVTLKVEWNDPVLGQNTTFHVSATGGSGNYKFRMDAPSYASPNEVFFESVADPSRGEWMDYTPECSSHDYSFATNASGTYNFKFYIMDNKAGVGYFRVSINCPVSDSKHPSVNEIVSAAVTQCNKETDGSDYAKALWLHDWLLKQLKYDKSLKWSSAESALTRGWGTCQAYESAYSRLLTAAGIENAETRDTYDGHTWNAMKLDGEWYQVDCTWDDTDDHWYNFDQTRLYFGLTDELMAIAHPRHAKIYTADKYATRSTSLADNYFVRSGDAEIWAKSYADRIQEQLNAGKTEFTIVADNKSYPPSISGIQNGIIAYALNNMEWSVNGVVINLQATGEATQFKFVAGEKGSVTGENFYGYTLCLDGTIAVNMYMDLPSELVSDKNAYMEFTLPNSKISTVKVTDAIKKDGHYVFTGRVAAKEMSQDIKVRMHANNKLGKEYSVSVQKYAEYIIEHPVQYGADVVSLVKSMLNYGAAAQKLFDYQTHKLANANLSDADKVINPGIFSNYKYVLNQNGNDSGIQWYGSSLILKSDTIIRDYFSLDASANINDYTFETGTTKLEPKEKPINGATYYYVEIPDIKAKNLDKAIVVTVKKGATEVLKLNYNAFSYAFSIQQNHEEYGKAITVTNAMYTYWQKANEFFSKQ